MDKLPVGQLPDLLSSNNDDEIMVITNSEYNQLKKEKISDLITDFTSTNENNALTKGTDGKMFVTDFGNASNITEGTLPTSVLPEIPLEKIPDIPKDKLPEIETSDLPASGVTADTYAYPSSVTVNAQGMVTAIAEGTPSGANANTDLSNLTDEGEKHFLNKTQITNCILSAPNGVVTYSGKTITVKQGLKVLIPNGRNADGTLRNIEVTLDSDKVFEYNNLNRFLIVNSDGTVGSSGGLSQVYFVKSFSELPTTLISTMQHTAFVYDDNKWYESNGSTTANWTPIYVCPIAKVYGTKNEEDDITSLIPFTPFRAVDYNDTEFIAHQSMPGRTYALLSVQSSGKLYTAPADGYVLAHAKSTTATGYIDMTCASTCRTIAVSPSSGSGLAATLPVRKAASFKISYNNISGLGIIFTYTNGAQ